MDVDVKYVLVGEDEDKERFRWTKEEELEDWGTIVFGMVEEWSLAGWKDEEMKRKMSWVSKREARQCQ